MTQDTIQAGASNTGHRGPHSRPRVAFFQASWPLQSHAINLAKALADSGHGVDVFLYDVSLSFVSASDIAESALGIHEWARRGGTGAEQEPKGPAWTEVKRKLRRTPRLEGFLRKAKSSVGELREWWLLCVNSPRGVVPRAILEQAIAHVRSAPHVALVGVEKRGLIWAAEVSRATDVPFAYYSLELYTRDHPNSTYSVQAKRVKRLEALSHRMAAATIIQDERRARVLFTDNGIGNSRVICLPVSVPGPPRLARTRFLHEHLGLEDEMRVVLQLGGIRKERLSCELAKSAQSFPPECVLVMHGQGRKSDLDAVKASDKDNRVVLSTELVSETRLPDLIASADVGLVLYGSANQNDILTAKSSEKLALFLRSGIPVVAFAYPGYEVVRDYDCGVLIDDLRDLPAAVSTILANPERYSVNAARCFVDLYDFNALVQPVVHALGHLRDL